MDKNDVIRAIENAQKGISQYLEIMAMLHDVKVDSHRDFQRRFNHFYRIRQRPAIWYKEYYSYMEQRKNNAPRFEEVLDYIEVKLGRYEPSFSSKLASTLNTNEPVWDQYVILNIGQKAPAYSSSNKFVKAKLVFQEIRSWYRNKINSEEGRMIIELFNDLVQDYDQISDIKKIDFTLWQMRS